MTLWYLMRALGLVALLCFTGASALGALASVGGTSTAAVDRRVVRQLVHRSVAVLGLVVLGLHLVCVVLDTSVRVPVSAVLVPFTAGYRPLALGAGTLALYAFVVAAVSGAVRGRLATSATGARRWRAVHLAAYAGWVLSLVHGFTAGTDSGTTWARAVYVASVAVVAVAVLLRLAAGRERRHPDARGHLRLRAGGAR